MVSGRELNWLLDGIDWFRVQPHEPLQFSSVMYRGELGGDAGSGPGFVHGE